MSNGVQAKEDMHPTYGVPQRLYDIQSAPQSGAAPDIAAQFLKQAAGQLGIDPTLADLKEPEVRDSVFGKHVLFQQQHAGKPVTGHWVRVDIDPQGKVFNVQNDLLPVQLKSKAKTADVPTLSEPEAQIKARETLAKENPGPFEVQNTEAVVYVVETNPVLAYKIVLIQPSPRGEWKVYVNAQNGEVLEVVSLLKCARGRVFDPNPVIALNDEMLQDTSVLPDHAYLEVELLGLDGSGHLDGPFVSTIDTPGRVRSTDGSFLFRRGQKGFKEVMAYFHIDRCQRYIQELGLDNVNKRPIKVNVDGTTEDNSFYSPQTLSLSFGTGGVDDAEDAEIILHEYGHSIQDNQVPGFGRTSEGGAMGEAFGDYLAASFFEEKKPARFKPTLGNWDAVAYSGDSPPSLRRLDSNKKYPRDFAGRDVHDDGEIWSACLWQIRDKLGRRTADKLIISHHSLLTPISGFEAAANALLTADQQLTGGVNQAAIRDVFIRRGILPNPQHNNKRAGVRFSDIVSFNQASRQRVEV